MPESALSQKAARVVQVLDGATVVLERGEQVRYLGLELAEGDFAPQGPKPISLRAWEANRDLVAGQVVRLEFDGAKRRDRSGRVAAYVFLLDGTFVNAELLRLGLARYSPSAGRYQGVLQAAQREAMEAGVGLWASPAEPK